MSSSDVSRHYQIYKEGGEQIARWLVSTAAYRERSRTARDVSSSVSTSRLLELAKSIASYRPPVHISDEILNLIEEVIDARENCANFYTSQGVECSGHRHYLKILRQVQKVLKQAQCRHGGRVSFPPPRRHSEPSGPISKTHEREASATLAEFIGLGTDILPAEGWTVVLPRSRKLSIRALQSVSEVCEPQQGTVDCQECPEAVGAAS
ncbi:hypothetical protein PRZ48_009709 [Zasmidium cellare]|uniref:DUF6604 domain-containing protein n=1 Tax=Zasmidium cellare TaxID=395010 RepID=A0ABR0ED58_ZASCE|nr:hypothetical protein PRZ48_009709 [Zasmidium cellare]